MIVMGDSAAFKVRDVYQGVEKASVGYKMLAAMGWQEGEGLGSSKQGIKTHIKATKKFDNSGVGAKEAAARSQDWTLSMQSYTQVLSGLKEVTSSHALAAMDSDAENEPESIDTKEAPKKAKKKSSDKKTGTKKRKASSTAQHSKKVAKESDEENAEDSGEEDVVEPRPKKVKLASHSGRYHKREKNKMVKGYSAADLAAILGQAAPAPLEEISARKAGQSTSSSDTDDASDDSTPSGERPASAAVSSSKGASSGSAAAQAQPLSSLAKEAAIVKVDEMPGDATAWWRHSFQRAGIVGSRKARTPAADAAKQRAIQIHNFSEQDQVELFNRTQGGRSTGRVGLGQSSAPKKVAGAHWAGKKTKLDSDSEDEDEPEAEAAAAVDDADDPNCDVLPGGVTIVWANGVRPAWFLERRSAAKVQTEDDSLPVPSNGKRQKNTGADTVFSSDSKVGKAASKSADESTGAGQLTLSSEAKKLCLKAAKRALKKSASGEVKLRKLHVKMAKAMDVHADDRAAWSGVLSALLKKQAGFSIVNDTVRLAVTA